MDNPINPVIKEFIDLFRREQAGYALLCSHTETRLKALMAQKGIMALVTARVKDPLRLEQKLCKLDAAREIPYQNVDEIFESVHDLIGARIALYFPADGARIPDLLEPQFSIRHVKEFPARVDNYDELTRTGFTAHKRRVYAGYDGRRFDGYCATHYWVQFVNPAVELPRPTIIEIQVASVLMHAWSEVEHDLAYKKMMGDVTQEEYACLDEINGLVMAGEIALNRLSQLSRKRILSTQTFDTHYTLAAYLSSWLKSGAHPEHPLGDVQKLFDSYRQERLHTHGYLHRQLHRLEEQNWYENPDPLAAQLLEEFGRQDHQGTVNKASFQALLEMGETELSEAQLGRFLGRWNALDRRIREALKQEGHPNLYRTTLNRLVEERFVLSEAFGQQYRELRMLRNQIVHDNLSPSMEDYRHIMAKIDELSKYLKTRYHIT